jgi:hypothetical protein
LLVGDDLTLDSDAAVLGFGADTDVTLTHVEDTGLLLNSTMAIQFNDASQFINAPSATVLDINATDEIELNATLVDINANLDVSGNVIASGTVEPAGDTSAGDNAAIGYTSAEGLILTGQGSTNDVTIKNDADADVIEIPTGTTNVNIAGDLTVKTSDGALLKLQTSDTTVVANDTLGEIQFSAPDEASGTDAILTSAAIEAEATATFSSSVNSADLVFKTGASEAAIETMRLTNTGNLNLYSHGRGGVPSILLNYGDTSTFQGNIIFTNSSGQLCFGMDGSTSNVTFFLDDEDGQPIFTFQEEDGTDILDGGDTDVTVHKPLICNSTINVTGITDFGSYQGTSVNSPVNVKSDSNHFAISLEENSGGETWQLGIDADGDLNFHNSGGATPSVTFDDNGTITGGPLTVSGSAGSTLTSSSTHVMSLVSTEAGTGDGPRFVLQRDSASPADNDSLGIIEFYGENDNDEAIEYARIYAYLLDASDGTEDGALGFSTKINSGTVSRLWMSATETVFNENHAALDFRVETDAEANAFVINGTAETASFGVPLTAPSYKSSDAGTDNTRFGDNAGAALVSGCDHNTVFGHDAGAAINSGDSNTFVGSQSGDVVTGGGSNVAVGRGTLGTETNGSRNVAIGQDALNGQNFTSATNSHNVAVGYNAGVANQTGEVNVFIGADAGKSVTTGGGNILIGHGAGTRGDDITTGNNNTLIGRDTGTSAEDANNNNVLGKDVAGSAADTFTFGIGTSDSAIASGGTSISAPSDERYKQDIETSTAGLSFINDLRPVTFRWKKEKDLPSNHRAYVEGSEAKTMNEKHNHGFIAQEVKTAIDAHSELKDGFNMWQADTRDGRQRVAPAELIPVLVKSIQELSAKIVTLETKVAALEAK